MSEEDIENLEITDGTTGEVYEIKKYLGKGKFSKCYELEMLSTKKRFAAKIQDENSEIFSSKMIQIEIDLLRTLKHPHIVYLYDYFKIGSNIYMLLELCSCGSLRTMLQKRQKLTIFEVRYFVKQICSALKYMHENEVIHRDIKLENIFLDRNMYVKIGDLNLSASTNTDEDWNSKKVGTILYMAPEALFERGLTYKSDIWSLGCVMYTLLVGHSPFDVNNHVKVICRHIKMCKYSVPKGLDRHATILLRKILQKDPRKRPDAAEILEDCFLAREVTPRRLRVSCLHTEPSFTKKLTIRKRPLVVRSQKTKEPQVTKVPLEVYSLRSGLKRKCSTQPTRKRCKTTLII